jgi:hypothetical protein
MAKLTYAARRGHMALRPNHAERAAGHVISGFVGAGSTPLAQGKKH